MEFFARRSRERGRTASPHGPLRCGPGTDDALKESRVFRKMLVLATLPALLVTACGSDGPSDPPIDNGPPTVLPILGTGPVVERYTAEVATRGNFAYTSTWSSRSNGSTVSRGNAIKVWNIAGSVPTLVDSVIVP